MAASASHLRWMLLLALVACSKAPADRTDDHATTHADDPVMARAAARAGIAKLAPAKPATLTHVTIKALGMYCEESCPLRVRYALAEIPAIYELGFDTSKESIFVSYDAALGSPKDVTRPMLAAIKQAGFDPWLAKEAWPDGAQSEAAVVLR